MNFDNYYETKPLMLNKSTLNQASNIRFQAKTMSTIQSRTEKVSKILKTWINKNREAILCQRSAKEIITFTPMWMYSLDRNVLIIYIPKTEKIQESLQTSKLFYKTISIVTHNSSKSDPTKNRGILFIGTIKNWEHSKESFDWNISNPSLLKITNSWILVTIEIYRVSFWSGISFGSYSWKKVPNNLYRGFEKRKFLPGIRNGNRVSKKDYEILIGSQFLIVATITKRGTIHASPVDFVGINNRILFATSFYSAKFRAFKQSNILVGYTCQSTSGYYDYQNALTFKGKSFAYGWNFWTGLFYNFLFLPYLAFVGLLMFRKYPRTIRKFPFRKTNIHWQFMPLVARTFIEIFWKNTNYWKDIPYETLEPHKAESSQ